MMTAVTKEHLDSELKELRSEMRSYFVWGFGVVVTVLLAMLAILFNMSSNMATLNGYIGENKANIQQVEKRLDRTESARAAWGK